MNLKPEEYLLALFECLGYVQDLNNPDTWTFKGNEYIIAKRGAAMINELIQKIRNTVPLTEADKLRA